MAGEWNERLQERGVALEFSDDAVVLLLKEGFSEEFGARNLERAMDRYAGQKTGRPAAGGWSGEGGGV